MRIVHLSLQMGRRVVNAPFCSAQCVERLIVRGNWCTSDSPAIKSDTNRINYKMGWSIREFGFEFGCSFDWVLELCGGEVGLFCVGARNVGVESI